MATFTQDDRPLRIQTKLGKDELLLSSFEGFEAVSKPFRFDVKMLSLKPDIDPKSLLGTPAVISYNLPTPEGTELRHIHGLFGRFTQVGRVGELTSYEGGIVPWLHYLSLAQDNRIFQKLSVIEFVKKVFEKGGYAQKEHFEFRTSGSYSPKEYVVQYKESNLNFIGRWLEREGLFYYFEHTEDKHVMVVTDDISSAPPCPPPDVAHMTAKPKPGQEAVTSVGWEQSVYIGKITLKDFDYLQPSLSLLAEIEGEGSEEIYEYPGGFTTQDEGERLARLMLEAEEAQRHVIHGTSTCRTFVAGHSFELREHPRADANGRYVLLEVKHEGVNGDYRSGSASEYDYRNSFLAIPEDVKYRPRMLTKKPLVHGTQTAIVVGPAGEEVYTDKHARVKVQFHWDREGKFDENSSCWVRVASQWGGKGYGGVSIPRIGNEVLIDFLEGDPDRPIIVGSIYNAEQTPPFALPGAGIQMGMKSRSSPGGGGHNEITMTDTKGKEAVTIHAQYDMTTTVLHDDTQTIKNNRTITVDGTHTETIKKDTTINVTEGKQSNTVKNEISVESQTASVSVKAKTEIKLEVGASKMVMKADGTINIEGINISVKGAAVGIDGSAKVAIHGGVVTSEADASHTTKGAIVMSEGSGTNTVKGGMVMLNP